MFEMSCPWCEAPVLEDPSELPAQRTCQRCLTSWTYEEIADEALPLAA